MLLQYIKISWNLLAHDIIEFKIDFKKTMSNNICSILFVL